MFVFGSEKKTKTKLAILLLSYNAPSEFRKRPKNLSNSNIVILSRQASFGGNPVQGNPAQLFQFVNVKVISRTSLGRLGWRDLVWRRRTGASSSPPLPTSTAQRRRRQQAAAAERREEERRWWWLGAGRRVTRPYKRSGIILCFFHECSYIY